MLRTLCLALFFTVAPPRAQASTPLTLADLKQLVADKAYEEALQHLDDIAPAQRTADWVAVAGGAATGYLEAVPTRAGEALAVIDAIDRRYPQIGKSAAYAKLRAERGPQGLAGCLDNNAEWAEGQDQCMEAGKRLAANGDRALGLAVARASTEHGTPAAAAPMWRTLAAADASACKEADLSRSVLAGLDRGKDTAIAGDARAVMVTCWAQLEAAVSKQFDDTGKGSDFHRNTCDQMKAKGKLSALQAKQCG